MTRVAKLSSLANSPARALALVRLAAPFVFLAAERLVDHPAPRSEPFDALLALTAVYAVGVAIASFTGRADRLPGWLLAAVDFTLICALVYTSGGPFSQLRFAFFLLPISAALLVGPVRTAGAAVACIAAYAVIAMVYPEASSGRPDAVGFEVTQMIFLGWMGGAAVVLSSLLASRTAAIEELSASRGRLVAQALEGEDRERRLLAEALHDEAVQNLLAARHELAVVARSDDSESVRVVGEAIDRTVEQLRVAVFDLHPYLLEHGGLGPAIEATVSDQARRGGYESHVAVDPGATGLLDQLLFSISRELVINVARHAQAKNLWVTCDRDVDDVVLEVADDGRGIEQQRLADALASGHIGIASCAERATAAGGQLDIDSEPGSGTTVRVRMPVSGHEAVAVASSSAAGA